MRILKKFYYFLEEFHKTSLCNSLKIRRNISGEGKCIICTHTALNIHKSAIINIEKGELRINDKWTANDQFPGLFFMGKNSRLTVKGSFRIYSGGRIYINNGAELVLGHGFFNNNVNIACFERIEIGFNCLISDNVTIRDSDNHVLLIPGFIKTKPVKIEDHVWIGMNSTILKGVTIGRGSIVAAGSVVTKDIPPSCLVAGVPARIIRENVEWD